MKCIVAFLIFISALYADVDDNIHILVSPSCKAKQLDKNEVKEIFLKKRQYFEGELIIVLDNPKKSIYKQFIDIYMDKTLREMKAYWMRMLFTGKTIPPEKLLLTNLNKYNDNICYICYFNKNTKLKNWNIIEIR